MYLEKVVRLCSNFIYFFSIRTDILLETYFNVWAKFDNFLPRTKIWSIYKKGKGLLECITLISILRTIKIRNRPCPVSYEWTFISGTDLLTFFIATYLRVEAMNVLLRLETAIVAFLFKKLKNQISVTKCLILSWNFS